MSIPGQVQRTIQFVIHVHPFFGYLALALRWELDERIKTACTDGETVRLSPTYFGRLTESERAFVVAHETMHAALSHIPRVRRLAHTPAEFARANIAADIIINGQLAQYFEVPFGAIRNQSLEHLSLEELYRCLPERYRARAMAEMLGDGFRDLDERQTNGSVEPLLNPKGIDWPSTLRQAGVLARQLGGVGLEALGMAREVRAALGEPEVDWVTQLHQFVHSEPTEWSGWDRRYLHREMYFPVLGEENMRMIVGVDTSGSISEKMLHRFLEELSGILSAVEQPIVDLYFTDTAAYGPQVLTALTDVSEIRPVGGGGTSFHPLFEIAAKTREREGLAHLPVIYFTDGRGPAPAREPDGVSTLWLVPPGGIRAAAFGEVVEMTGLG
jgi:predicted metal-dependent peptidase